MEKKNKITLFITVIICLLPIALGIVLYNKLPDNMPIHFTISDQPDNYAPKNFALFGIPIIMAVVQLICLLAINRINDINKNGKPKILKIFEWFIPIITVLLYVIMVEFSLGSDVYVGKSICLILGILFIIIGNYIPKVNYEIGKVIFHPTPKDQKSFRKFSKVLGYSFIAIGILLLILIIWA